MLDIVIRVASESDTLACAKLFNLAFNKENNVNTLSTIWKKAIRINFLKLFLSEANQRPVGFGGLIQYQSIGFIGYMSVHPHYQKQRIGKSIFSTILNYCKENKIKAIYLFASEKGIGLYQKFGFISSFKATRYSISSLIKENWISNHKIIKTSSIPEWVLQIDQDIYDFSRKKFFEFLIELGGQIWTINKSSYCFVLNNLIGPIISTNQEEVKALIYEGFRNNFVRLVIPDNKLETFSNWIKFSNIGQTTCTFMSFPYNNNCNLKLEKIYGFYSFGTG